MTKKEAIMIIADQNNGSPGEIVEATNYLMNLQEWTIGKWIPTARNGILCSECKSGLRRMPVLCGRPLFKFCPFCGVKMEAADE